MYSFANSEGDNSANENSTYARRSKFASLNVRTLNVNNCDVRTATHVLDEIRQLLVGCNDVILYYADSLGAQQLATIRQINMKI